MAKEALQRIARDDDGPLAPRRAQRADERFRFDTPASVLNLDVDDLVLNPIDVLFPVFLDLLLLLVPLLFIGVGSVRIDGAGDASDEVRAVGAAHLPKRNGPRLFALPERPPLPADEERGERLELEADLAREAAVATRAVVPDGRSGRKFFRERDEAVGLLGQGLRVLRGAPGSSMVRALLVATTLLGLVRRRGRCNGRVAAGDLFETCALQLRARLLNVCVVRRADDEFGRHSRADDVQVRHLELVALQLVERALIARLAIERPNADPVRLVGFAGHQRSSWIWWMVKPSISAPRCHSRKITLAWPVFADEKRRKPCRRAGV